MNTYNPLPNNDFFQIIESWEDTRRDFDRFVRFVKAEWFQFERAFTVYLESDGYYALTDRTSAKGYGFTNPVARFEREGKGPGYEGEWLRVAVKVIQERRDN